MNIDEKYLSKKNKFNIDKKIIFETKDNLNKIKNNNEILFLYKFIIKTIKKIDEKEKNIKFIMKILIINYLIIEKQINANLN